MFIFERFDIDFFHPFFPWWGEIWILPCFFFFWLVTHGISSSSPIMDAIEEREEVMSFGLLLRLFFFVCFLVAFA